MNAYIGQIMMIAFGYAPRGWMLCNGALLAISTNQALFSLLGTTYGGDGRTTFALPDLRGRIPLHSGQGPGLSTYTYGQIGGSEAVTLLASQIPQHTHQVNAYNGSPDQPVPGGNIWANEATSQLPVYSDATPDALMNPAALSSVGGSQPHTNLQPYTALNYVICTQGLFPPRN